MSTNKKTGEAVAKADVYQIITDRILEMLEKGVAPWQKPWQSPANGGLLPTNYASKKAYRGINYFMLSMLGRSCPFWVTFNQARELGGSVRKGEKGTPIVFWKRLPVTDEKTGEKKVIPLLRYYTVFNLEQVDGIKWSIPALPVKAEHERIADAEKIYPAMPDKPALSHGGDRACYSPTFDAVKMPNLKDFLTAEQYYAVLFHELTHATGHAKRLNRDGVTDGAKFGSDKYGKEELCAEMGSAFLCAHVGISPQTIGQSASYLDSWIRAIKGDRKLVVIAAAQAQRAFENVLGIKYASEEQGEEKAA